MQQFRGRDEVRKDNPMICAAVDIIYFAALYLAPQPRLGLDCLHNYSAGISRNPPFFLTGASMPISLIKANPVF